MEIAQTGSDTWRWCMGMFGARFAVFVRRARVLLSPCPATRNLLFLRCSPAPSHCCFNSLFTGLGRVSVKIPQDGNRTRVHGSGATVPTRIGSLGFCVLIKVMIKVTSKKTTFKTTYLRLRLRHFSFTQHPKTKPRPQ